MKNEIKDVVIYQNKDGAIELKSDFSKETVWASQAQIAKIFKVNPQAITKHLINIYKEKELDEKATCSKMEHVQIENGRTIKRKIKFYNLDAIISIGYRINSITGTKFRQWATKTLKRHITEGYTINKNQIFNNYQKFLKAIDDVKKLMTAGETKIDTENILELVKMFASTWFDLDAFDKGNLPQKGLSKKEVTLTADELEAAIYTLRNDLINKKEASDLFAKPRTEKAIHGILGNVFQTFDGEDFYPTVEEKAAHLFYFMVKNHPFTDGNKRSGAFAFVWFLSKVGILNPTKTTPQTLTALTLLVAESKPVDKDRMIGLILSLIK